MRLPAGAESADLIERRESAPVLVVDDHPALRRGVGAMLEDEPGIGPVAAAASGSEAMDLVVGLRPRVAVLDYHLPDEDGLSLCLRLKSRSTPPRVLIYSAFADEHLMPLALIAGADWLLSKDADPEDLSRVVRELAVGKRLMAPPSPAAMESAGSRLDPEDLPILGMLAHGTEPAEIAATLGIEPAWLGRRRRAMLELLAGGSPGRLRAARA